MAKWYKPVVDEVETERKKAGHEAFIVTLDAELSKMPVECMPTYCGVRADRFSAAALVRILEKSMNETERERALHRSTMDLLRAIK